VILAERGGFEPPVLAYTRFPSVRLKPLGHLSESRAPYRPYSGAARNPKLCLYFDEFVGAGTQSDLLGMCKLHGIVHIGVGFFQGVAA
jgi:hypothetical protein